MLGQATARLQPVPRRWMLRLWGAPDIHTRQKWTALWPLLARLPHTGVRLLDAGCGEGRWSLELAMRRPGWDVTGIDCAPHDVAVATRAAESLGVRNARFACVDFLAYAPSTPVDVVLAVASAHYLVEDGHGAELFRRFGEWLAPGGQLLLFGPRRRDEVPRLAHLPPPFRMRDVFSRDALATLCGGAGLAVERLVPTIGPLGTYAKQVSCRARSSRALALATYPLQVGLSWCDQWADAGEGDAPSSAWLLSARRSSAPASAG